MVKTHEKQLDIQTTKSLSINGVKKSHRFKPGIVYASRDIYLYKNKKS
jgi:hypothetical protein